MRMPMLLYLRPVRRVIVLMLVLALGMLVHVHRGHAEDAKDAKDTAGSKDGTSATTAASISHTFDAKGVKIHYTLEGKGEPVILIHGLLASGDLNWRLPGITAAIAKDHQVVSIDMPGHGQSDRPKEEAAYGKQIVEDVVMIMDDLKIKKAHIVGYSLGGMVTVKMMVTHPDRVQSAAVCGMGWLKEGGPMQKFWEKWGERKGTGSMPSFLHAVGQLAVTEEELKKIDLPVTVIVGDKDPVKAMYVEPLRKVRTDWPVVEIKDAEHLGCVIKPQFREEIVSWLKKNEAIKTAK